MVVQSVIFGLAAALIWGVSDFTMAVLSKKLGVLRTAVGANLVGAIFSTGLYIALGEDLGKLGPGDWVALALLSVLASGIILSFYRGMQLGPVAIVSPLSSTYAVLVVLMAVAFLGERLNAGQVAGATASIGGVVLASLDLGNLRRGARLVSEGVIYGLAATLGFGVWQYAIGVMSRELGWFLPIYVSRLLTLAVLAPIGASARQWPWQRLSPAIGAGVAVVGTLDTLGLLAFSRGTEVGLISIVTAASTTYPVVPILGGLIAFRERLALSQYLGLAMVLAGLLLLGLSAR